MAHRKILIVDDDYSFAEFAKVLLETMGYRAVISLDGAHALELARSERPDLILMDFNMPGMDGIETIRKLKASPFTQGIPVILCSITQSREEVSEALDVGAVDFIPKPLKRDELKLRIQRTLGLPAH